MGLITIDLTALKLLIHAKRAILLCHICVKLVFVIKAFVTDLERLIKRFVLVILWYGRIIGWLFEKATWLLSRPVEKRTIWLIVWCWEVLWSYFSLIPTVFIRLHLWLLFVIEEAALRFNIIKEAYRWLNGLYIWLHEGIL